MLLSSRTLYDHSFNVCFMSLVLGRSLGLAVERRRSLGRGALLHDLGMMRAPAEIRDSVGELSPEELAQVRKHPTWGRQTLSMTPNFPYDALNIVLDHHERADGTGCPNGLSKKNIPYMARIVKVVDTYDAMTSPRPHRPALSTTQAASPLLERSGSDLDREMTIEFLRLPSQAIR
ncbi:HD-GYP domain-containing protein [Dethiosulfatarculus sandiegensis]|uniref:HD-GYP domain-containing protein n=1 Tax=Dethiosulfatarculus sandiegensis TaxID=1429043 RepID=A0A0D2GEX3_9BACT|nr:HD domain-containing phosphohydrolase [Dethiosulfatarculus sandiegensis]KIX13472.1 hypothetical protein X474_13385 [Dethiosulfatarculus sandiegensis]